MKILPHHSRYGTEYVMAKSMHSFKQVSAPATIQSESNVIYLEYEESAFVVLCRYIN